MYKPHFNVADAPKSIWCAYLNKLNNKYERKYYHYDEYFALLSKALIWKAIQLLIWMLAMQVLVGFAWSFMLSLVGYIIC